MDGIACRTRAGLRGDVERLGVVTGDVVMAHAAVSRVGRLLNGPDALIGALVDATSPRGTVVAYTDWDARYDELLDSDGRVPEAWRPHVPPFDAAASRAARDNGVLPEFLRTWPEARRSASPGASVAAVGARAEWITADHPLDYGYGEGSPLAKLVSVGGKVLIDRRPSRHDDAAPPRRAPGRDARQAVIRYEVPFARSGGGVEWRMVEEFDTADPVVEGLDDDSFGTIVRAFLDSGRGVEGMIGTAPSVLVEAAPITAFAVDWLERHQS